MKGAEKEEEGIYSVAESDVGVAMRNQTNTKWVSVVICWHSRVCY